MKVKASPGKENVVVELGKQDAQTVRVGTEQTPFAIKNVLVPIDFSDTSKKALQYAIPFAKQFGAAIRLIHIVQPMYPTGDLAAGYDYDRINLAMSNKAREQLTSIATTQIPQDVASSTSVIIGRPATEIAAAAREFKSDVIVISTHGYTGLKHVFMGSVAEHVVRYAPCPVLVVREKEHEFLADKA